MAMSSSGTEGEVLSDINVTPLVDVMLVLLIIFIITVPVALKEIKVNLPTDPGEGFHEGTYVELINTVINTYEMRNDSGQITASGLWFKADGLKPATTNAGLSSAA